jgi:hypothetical protein
VKNLAAMNILLVLAATCAFLSFPSAQAQTVGTWTNAEAMPTPRFDLAVVALDGKIYAIGGRSGLNLANLNANEQYNSQTKTWTKMAVLPNPQSRCVATAYNGKIYDFSSGLIQIYNPQTNQWTTKPFSPGNQWIGTANEVNGKIYLLGGGQNYNSVQVYDPTTNSLTAKTSCPQHIADHAAVALDNKIYVMESTFPQLTGGVPVSHSLTLIYDTSRDTWSYGASSPINVQFPAIAEANVSGLPVIYLFGGSPQDFSATIPPPASTYVQIYHPNSNSWTTGASLPTIRAHGGAAVVDNKIYVIGGTHSGTYLTAMQPQLIGITNIDPNTGSAQGVWGSPVPTKCLVSVEESTNQAYVFEQQAISTPTRTPTLTLPPSTTISKEQAVQIALQKAQTSTVLLPLDNTSQASGLAVNPIPKQVAKQLDIDIRYKWLITFNVDFSSPVGNYRSGTIGFMVAADTGEIEHFNVLDSQSMAGMGLELQVLDPSAPTLTPAFSPSPTVTPSPTSSPSPSPKFSPTQEPTTVPTPSPSAPQPKIENITLHRNIKNPQQIDYNFSINEEVSLITYTLDNQANTTTAGNFTLYNLSNGNHNLTLYVTDLRETRHNITLHLKCLNRTKKRSLQTQY